MTVNWPNPIVQAIARRRSVILIGSGVSANSVNKDGKRPVTWGNFLKEANKNLESKKRYIGEALKSFNYLEACDYLKSEYGAQWPDLIRETFVSPGFKPADIHKNIFELDSRIVASLNFDKIYETYAIKASENTIVIKNYYDPDIRQAVAGSERYIIKPHGSVDAISRMIFTSEDYAKARVEHSSFYEVMTALLHTHTFICIGCGLADPDIRLIFEDYRYRYSESPHYICLPEPIADAEAALIQKTRGLNVLRYSNKNVHIELTESLAKLVERVTLAREEIVQQLNW